MHSIFHSIYSEKNRRKKCNDLLAQATQNALLKNRITAAAAEEKKISGKIRYSLIRIWFSKFVLHKSG